MSKKLKKSKGRMFTKVTLEDPKGKKKEKKEDAKPSLRGCVDCIQRGRTRHAFCDVHQKYVARKQPVCKEKLLSWTK